MRTLSSQGSVVDGNQRRPDSVAQDVFSSVDGGG